VGSVAVYNGELYAMGSFTSAGGTPASSTARWNGAQWSPLGAGFPSAAYGLGVHGGRLYAVGWFTSVNGQPSYYIASWKDMDGDADGNNVVNFGDLNLTLSNYGAAGAPDTVQGDVDNDGTVGFGDLNAVLSVFGRVCVVGE